MFVEVKITTKDLQPTNCKNRGAEYQEFIRPKYIQGSQNEFETSKRERERERGAC